MVVSYAEGVTQAKYSVYVLINPLNNIIFYVGYTSNTKGRYQNHITKIPKTREGNVRWKLIQLIHNLGHKIKMETVETFEYRGDAMKFESKLVGDMLKRNQPILNYPSKVIAKSFDFHSLSL